MNQVFLNKNESIEISVPAGNNKSRMSITLTHEEVEDMITEPQRAIKGKKNNNLFDSRTVSTHIHAVRTGKLITGAVADVNVAMRKIHYAIETYLAKTTKPTLTIVSKRTMLELRDHLRKLKSSSTEVTKKMADELIRTINKLIGA